MQSIGSILQICICSILIIRHAQVNGGFACLSNPCMHGVCLDDLNTTYSCYCIDGYTGVQCQTNWDECWSNPCQNGGVCLDGIASFNCSCPAGFTGDVCEEDFNECESNPCLNNGTCLDGRNGYTCNCAPGYSGEHCEEDVAVCNATAETRCLNGGICIEGPGATFTCKCQPGWTGFLCDVEIDECMSSPCENGAICIDLQADYACACLFGFAGRNCEEVVLVCEDNPCRNGALCLMEEDHPVCYCVPDYHGDRCQYQYDECQLGPRCMNGGTCIDGVDNFTCSCPPNLTGVLCECLIIDDHYLDCTYISPPPFFNTTVTTDHTTTDNVLTTLSTITTLSTTEETTTSTTESTTLETTSLVPNFTETTLITTDFETTTQTDVNLRNETTTSLFTTSSTTEFETITADFTSENPTTLSSSTFTLLTSPPTTVSSTTTEEIVSTITSTNPPEISSETTPEESTTHFTTSTDSTETMEIITYTIIPTHVTIVTDKNVTITSSTDEDMGVTSTTSSRVNITSSTDKDFTITGSTSKDGREMSTLETTISTFFTERPTEGTDFTITEFETSITAVSTTTEFTTVSDENTTTPYFPDCSVRQNRCQNGGSCVYTIEGHRCICPFDTDGPLCEHHLGIKNAAFNGDSFLSHRLNSRANMAIEFKSKTTSNSGLLFYANIDQTYMTLFIEKGYLKFKFSCGYQTMLLSELGKPVNNGYEMRINAELAFSKDYNHCNASIKLNNTLSMSGDQIALVDKFSKINSRLYLGGVPNEYVKDKIQPGFIGCMSNLKISGKKVHIFKDAEDGFEVSECSSLACLSNPCQNHGLCTAMGDNWSCHCKNGFSGLMCEVSTCDNNPCQFGGTCLPHAGSGYICLCPFGKHGHFCENELQITKPYFSSSIHGYSSYVAYPIPKGNFNRMEFKFKFSPTTMDQISILMFIGQKGRHDYHSDHMAVSFVKGYIMLTWNLGSGPRRIFTTKPITAGKNSYTVHIGRLSRRSWLYVENIGNVTGRSPGNLIHLDVIPLIYIGGHEVQNFSALPHDLPLHSGFSGCIFDVEFRAGDIVIPLESSSQAVGRGLGQCGTTECHDKICQNEGACLYHGGTFTCLCQDGNFGPLCSSKYNLCDSNRNNCASGSTCVTMIGDYECDCPIGKTGKFCNKDEILSDISFTGVRSYLSLPPKEFETQKFNLEFELRPLENKGIILFIGRDDKFVSLSILSGLLELRILPGRKRLHMDDIITIRSNRLIVLGSWYKVRIVLYGRKLYLFVNNVVNTGILQPGEIVNLSDEDIFIGGLPDLSTLPNEALSFLPVAYNGCFRKFIVNNKHIPLNAMTIKSSRNIRDCDGTPCGGDYCENSGTCWLDPNLKPHCSCIEPFYGERCENIPNCTNEKACQNRGRCLSGRCLCTVGWHGAFCETSITVKTPKFQGNSFLLVNKAYKKRATSSLKSILLNFTTAGDEGIIFWTQKGNRFIGIGLEKGLLKLAYTTTNFHKNIEVPDMNRIADGLLHSIELHFQPFNLTVDANSIDISTGNDVSQEYLSIYDDFFIGGVPSTSNSYKEAKNIFHGSFEGCVYTFGTNKDFIVNDFSEFEGENVGTCSIT